MSAVFSNTSELRETSFIGRGDLLTSYFSQNSGVPYRYAAKTNMTVPFPDENESSAINAARRLIEDRIHGVFPIDRDYFNEVLTVAYLEEQNMSVSNKSFVYVYPLDDHNETNSLL
jgi:hypothetical protein